MSNSNECRTVEHAYPKGFRSIISVLHATLKLTFFLLRVDYLVHSCKSSHLEAEFPRMINNTIIQLGGKSRKGKVSSAQTVWGKENQKFLLALQLQCSPFSIDPWSLTQSLVLHSKCELSTLVRFSYI